jgi:hypothetical protein
MKEGQILVVPKRVAELLRFRKFSLITPIVPIYRFSRFLNLDWFIKAVLLPPEYKKQIHALDVVAS